MGVSVCAASFLLSVTGAEVAEAGKTCSVFFETSEALPSLTTTSFDSFSDCTDEAGTVSFSSNVGIDISVVSSFATFCSSLFDELPPIIIAIMINTTTNKAPPPIANGNNLLFFLVSVGKTSLSNGGTPLESPTLKLELAKPLLFSLLDTSEITSNDTSPESNSPSEPIAFKSDGC